MSATLLIGAGLGLAALLLVLTIVVPRDVRRGVTVAVVLILLFGATSDSVPNEISQAVQVVCAGLLLLALFGSGPTMRTGPSVLVPLLAFLGLGLLVTLVVFPAGDLLALRLAAIAGLAALVVGRFGKRDVRALMYGVILLALLELGLGVVELTVAHEPIPWGYKVYADGRVFDSPNPLLGRGVVRVQGSTGHPIPYAVVMALGLAALAAVWRDRGYAFRVVVAAACLTGLLLSGSRSVIVAVALAGVFVLLTSRVGSRSLRILVATLIAAIAAVLFASELFDEVGTLVDSGSYTNRTGALGSIPALLGRPPLEMLFGNGLGNQMELYVRGILPQDGFFVVDNQLVSTLGATGVIGAALLVVVFVQGIRRADRVAKPFVLILAVMLFSFDYVVWVSILTMLAVVVALPRASAAQSTAAVSAPNPLASVGKQSAPRGAESGWA